jgi:hypothetical protein
LWSPKDSLIAYNIKTHRMRRGHYLDAVAHPRWSGVRFVQLRSPGEVRAFMEGVGAKSEEARAKSGAA